MRLLLRKYGQKGSPYLFPVLSAGKDGHEAYKTALRKYNSLLVIIGARLHLSVKLTSYVARHSWATEALRQNIPVAVISQAMGHTSEKTTRIYPGPTGPVGTEQGECEDYEESGRYVSGKGLNPYLRNKGGKY